MRSARVHRNSLPLAHLLTYTLSLALPLTSPPSHARRLMHRDIAKHAHTRSHRSSLAQEKTRLLKRCAASSVHWPLVVNNDMTHPAERLLFTWAWWGRTGVHGVRQPGSPLPPRRRLEQLISAARNSQLCFSSVLVIVFLFFPSLP